MALILGPTLAQQAPTRAGKGGMGKGEERVGEAGRAGDGAAETQLLCLPHLDRAGDGAAETQLLCLPHLDRAGDGAAETQLQDVCLT